MADEVDFAPEVVAFIKETVWKDGRWMAVMGKAVYERWGKEAINVLCKEFYEFGKTEGEMYKREAGYEGREDELTVEIVMTEIYSKVFKHLRVAGFEKSISKFSATEADILFSRCPILDSWISIWDKPWFMCQIAKAYDEGFMHGVHPQLEWTHYAEKNGQEGLARGKPCERIRLAFKPQAYSTEHAQSYQQQSQRYQFINGMELIKFAART